MKRTEKNYFCEAVNYYLKKKKIWTQEWLANKTGVSQQTISNICKGESFSREKTRLKIADAFCVDYLDFLKKGEEQLNEKNGITPLKKDNKEHHKIIDQFDDPEMATDFNRVLLKIQQKDKKTFKRLYKQAKFELSELEKDEKKTTDGRQVSGEH